MNEGRVEVFRDGEWQSVCDDSWDTRDGDVVGRQLGYAHAIKVVGNALFGELRHRYTGLYATPKFGEGRGVYLSIV